MSDKDIISLTLTFDEIPLFQSINVRMDKKLPVIINDRISFSANIINIIVSCTILYLCILNALRKKDNIVFNSMWKLGTSNTNENTNIVLICLLLLATLGVSIWVMFEQKQTLDSKERKDKQYISGMLGTLSGFLLFGYLVFLLILNRNTTFPVNKMLSMSAWQRGGYFFNRNYMYFIYFMFVCLFIGINILSMIELKVKSKNPAVPPE